MHFLIYGAGALGQAIGCMLAADGHKVDLVLRPRFVEALQTTGLRVTGIFGDHGVPPGQIGLFTGIRGRSGRDYEAILLTTKTYDTDKAISDIAALHECYCPVVSLQNGCGNLEKLAERLGRERSLAGRVITGFEIERPGVVRITVSADAIHVGGCVRGTIPAAAKRLADALSHAGLPSIAVADIYQSLFAKLLYNCALNPLGALLGVPYGALGESAETRMLMDQVIEETFAVINAMGGTTPWPDAASYGRVFYGQLIPATSNHRASMLQDLDHNKPTEVEAMVGYVAAQGRKFGVPTPCCDFLAALVRFKEQQMRQPT
ncbi:2-dehydropantoate 2-reductase [Desulfobulbus propionicus DSM 2032]|uniref:2-dehydropantoate 2-reductase n=1 Tax=Desulfobulbus propionicus (strain ATCC 33891 / DSM 2032 / VKM B-1956 / 1pr3) TaxID=577650 RepID=A0A7U3YQ31_DESPD|nr:ketopantoate reductase family protein [Desulfobulbus propionicus]ADW19470.1 2-dehydropantoate 2-reductase [Desulfobulbus propionicus DSM 2032]